MIDTGVLQLSILAILLGGNVYAYLRFQVDMKAARAAIDAYDTVKIETSFGQIELVDSGTGFPTLSARWGINGNHLSGGNRVHVRQGCSGRSLIPMTFTPAEATA